MARAKESFTINKPKEEVYRLLSDPASVGGCLSFVKGTGNGDGLLWDVKSPMSTVTGTSSLSLEFQATPEGEIKWHGQGSHLETRGHLLLEENKEQETEVEFALEMTGLGPMSVVIEPLASVQIGNQIAYFMDCVRGKLETS